MAELNVLAVADPAVKVYINDSSILKGFSSPVNFFVVPWAEYYPMMLNAFEGKENYDVVMIAGHLWKAQFASKGFLTELHEVSQDILLTIQSEMQYNGKNYLSPSFCDGHMIVYKKSVMHKLGIKLDSVLTPNQYYEIAKTLHANGYRIAMKAHPSEIFTDALPFMRAYGGDVYDDNGNFAGDNKEVVEGLRLYKSLKEFALEGTNSFGNEEIIKAFTRNDVGMSITWSGQIGFLMNAVLDKDDVGFATLDTAWNVTWSFAVLNTSNKKEKAEQFLQYLVSPQVDFRVGCACGAPILKSSYEKGMQDYPHFSSQLKMIEKFAKPLPDMVNAGDKNAVLYEQITKAFEDTISCKEGMDICKKRMEKIEKKC